MRAIVLADGRWQHQPPGFTPSCLLKVRGRTLLERLLTSVQYAGIRFSTCVVGCGAEEVVADIRRFNPRLEIDLAMNPDHERGGAHSLYAGRAQWCDDIVVLDTSILFPIPLVKMLVEFEYESAALFDPRERPATSADVVVADQRVVPIESVPTPLATECRSVLGVFKFGRRACATLAEFVDANVAIGPGFAYRDACRRVVEEHQIAAVSVDDAPWRRIESQTDWSVVTERTSREVVLWEIAHARRAPS